MVRPGRGNDNALRVGLGVPAGVPMGLEQEQADRDSDHRCEECQ
jgi:hypothetical protein